VPVFSFLVQRGRVRGSAARLSSQYPLVEIATGVLFALLGFRIGPYLLSGEYVLFVGLTLLWVVIISLCVVIFVYDLKHKIIPDPFVFALIGIAFVVLFVSPAAPFVQMPTLQALAAGPIVAAPLFLLWLVSGGRWMGFGDVKLMLGVGWLLGISTGLASVILAFWIGAVIGVFVLWYTKRLKKNAELPFAPFLLIGSFIAFVYTIDIEVIMRFVQSLVL
jgi:prepilin signal peptidase PulO-like enzyme (type II secretory pathway)